MEKAKRAVVLLSGGIDSSTTLALALSEGYACYALSFDYSQRHRRELASAKRVAESLRAHEHRVIGFDLRTIGGSALTADVEVPKEGVGDWGLGISEEKPGMARPSMIPITYVPARNTIFLSFGLAWAEVLGAPDIFIGANIVDYSGYPDCRPEYLTAFQEMANLATKASVEGKMRFRIRAPLLYLSKPQIIKQGARLGLDYALTWSCYDPQPPPQGGDADAVPCGRCDSCRIRAQGFLDAGLPDPLAFR
ncbi:MAG: 7-cyano-7-deazaguanine synthase QueC [bacterium]